ncbi:phosphopyruvate hydratase [candidate division WOR-3 bacterium]|nr:phosphopyruvate hydratase [candidate division WOR-3 bacterium]
MKSTIEKILAREILDSRGNPTVEVDIELNDGVTGRAAVPSGASTGIHEAIEMRDGDKARYAGKGVLKAVANVNEKIAPALCGKDVTQQAELDRIMLDLDGTPNKKNLGANAICGVSLAIAGTAARAMNIPLYKYLGGDQACILPVPMMNVINGGAHTLFQGPDFQEYMIVPYGAETFREALRWGSETYHALKNILLEKGLKITVADEGGFVPQIASNDEPLDIIVKAIEKAHYRPGEDIGIGLDVAPSCFYKDGTYTLSIENKTLDSHGMIDKYAGLVKKYPIVSIEDGLAEDDWEGWKALNKALGAHTMLIGDDIFVTNVQRIERGIREEAANAALIKPNQIGTITETIAAVRMAQKVRWGVVVSHRSGETTDTFIADFTVAMGAGALKTGAPCRGERVEKYNQLVRIEEDLKDAAEHAGRDAFVR